MTFEVPTDLIHQVQIALRKDAGLSSYNPYDTTPSPLPSLAAAISDLDQSSSSVRCNYCEGRLLNGMQSMICVYCGKQQKRDVPHEPIAFNSTYAYRFLLESLGLDGSETIGPDTEESETNRGQSIPKDEISLSKLLDLRIPWLDEPEKSEINVKDKNLEQNESLVTLTGVDLVNYFQEPNSNIVFNAFQDQPVLSNQIEGSESKEVSGQDNLDLFQNVPVESGDDLSGWEASFQSADNHNQHGSLKSADPFQSSTIDLTAHIDSVFGGGESLNDVKPNDNLVLAPSMINNSTEDDLFNTSLSQPSDSASKDVNDQSLDNGDLFQDNQWQSQSTVSVGVFNKVNSAESQPLDSASKDVNDQSSGNGDWFEDNQWQSQSTVNAGVDNKVNSAESQPLDSHSKDVNDQSSKNGDRFQDNQWQSQSTVNIGVDNKVNAAESQPLDSASKDFNDQSSDNGDLFQDNQWQSQSTVNVGVDNKVNSAESQPLDSASKDVNNQSSDSGDWFADNQWQSQSTVNGGVDNKVNSSESQPLDSASKDVNDQSSDNGDWFEDNQWQCQSTVNVGVDNNVNSAESQPLDYASKDVNYQSSDNGDWFQDNQWQSQSTVNVGADNKVKSAESQSLDYASKDVNDQSSDNGDWFQDNQWQSQSSVNVGIDNKVNSAESQPLDSAVNSLTLTKPSTENFDWFNDNQWQTNITSVPNDKAVNENEDQFDEWNEFTSSNNPQEVPSSTGPIKDQISEINLFNSPSNFQELDFGSFLPEGPNSERNGDLNSNAENIDTILKPKDDVEMLMSPMYDFSFMGGNNILNNALSQSLDSASKDVNNHSSDNVDLFQDSQLQSQNTANVGLDKKVNTAESQPFDSAVNSLTLTNPSSQSNDWFNDNQWQTNVTSVPNDKTINENEDSFDEWNDFMSSNNPHEVPSSTNAIKDQISEVNMFNSHSNFQEVDIGSFFPEGSNSKRNGDLNSNTVENIDTVLKPKDDVGMLMSPMRDFSFMPENNIFNNALSQPLDSASKDVKDQSSDNVDWFQDNQWQSQSTVNTGIKKVNSAESQPFGSVVNSLTLSNPSSESIDWFNDNQWQTNVTSVTNDKTVNENEDSFDEWNDFTSANNPQEIPSSTNAINDQISNKNMFNSPGNFQELDFGSFFSEGSNSKRNGDSNIDKILKPKDDVETLMSQMHDFSSMLENNLSIPPKSEAIGSFSHD